MPDGLDISENGTLRVRVIGKVRGGFKTNETPISMAFSSAIMTKRSVIGPKLTQNHRWSILTLC